MTMRERLRTATQHAHHALERDLALAERLADQRSAVLVLARFAGFFSGLEPALDRWLGASVMAGRHRMADLRSDLQLLGLTPDEIRRLPPCLEAGALAGPNQALGALYVTEGARLGGRLIARELARLDWAPPGGLRFWADLSPGLMWRTLVDRLDAIPSAEAGMVETGANLTFERLHGWLAAGGAFD